MAVVRHALFASAPDKENTNGRSRNRDVWGVENLWGAIGSGFDRRAGRSEQDRNPDTASLCRRDCRCLDFGTTRRDILHHGPFGQWQVHAGAPCQPLDRAKCRDDSGSGTGRTRSVSRSAPGASGRADRHVFQHMALLPHRSVQDNVAYPLELRGTAKAARWHISREKLKLVGLTGYEDRFPKELSGGMQQRVGLARALAADPDILLMDEPFSALDPLIRRQLQDQFMALSHKLGKTTLFITHDLDEAIRLGHRIAIMKDGRIVQTGTPEQIVTQPADDYVRDFVHNISKLGLIFARTVMEPLAKVLAVRFFDVTAAPKASPESNLEDLIDIAAGAQHPVVIEDGGVLVGAITKDRLLVAIKEGK